MIQMKIRHKIFGDKENVEYNTREGTYLVPISDDKIGVIKTSKGYFFLGGGIEKGEDHITCLKRECVEEAGLSISVKDKVCTAETYTKHPEIGYFHPIQTYYIGEIIAKVSVQTEEDHEFVWVDYEKLNGNMFVEMQNWALERCFEFEKRNENNT